MKKHIIFFIGTILLSLYSCKKCSTCTYKDIKTDSTYTSKVCDTGKSYENQMYQYNKSGWKCVEEK